MDLFNMKAREKGIDLICDQDEKLLAFITIDEVRVKQVLLNLIGNAMKFTSQGMVKITAEVLRQGDEDMDIAFRVKDTGIGIPEDQQKKIFDAFTQQDGQSTRKYGGTGLGLAISRKLALMMGGEITLESQVGQGSQFSLVLNNIAYRKAAVSPDEDLVKVKKEEQYVFAPARVLIAEDIYSNIEVLLGHLREYEFEFFISENGKDALEKAKNLQARHYINGHANAYYEWL